MGDRLIVEADLWANASIARHDSALLGSVIFDIVSRFSR
jgi:hypothetical protein